MDSGVPDAAKQAKSVKKIKRGRKARRAKSKSRREALDLPELGLRGQHDDSIVVEETMTAGQRRHRVETVFLLDRYLKRRLIDHRSYEAGVRLRSDWTLAGRQPRTTGRYEEAISGGQLADMSLSREAAYRRFRNAIAAVGPIANDEVIDVCLMDRPAGSEARMEIARRGLRVLASHYGIPLVDETAK